MLNKNLRDEVLIHLVGLILRRQKCITTNFNEQLQSEIIFLLRQRNVSIDDHVFEEGDLDDRLGDAE